MQSFFFVLQMLLSSDLKLTVIFFFNEGPETYNYWHLIKLATISSFQMSYFMMYYHLQKYYTVIFVS